jgi:hypothetical protein
MGNIRITSTIGYLKEDVTCLEYQFSIPATFPQVLPENECTVLLFNSEKEKGPPATAGNPF